MTLRWQPRNGGHASWGEDTTISTRFSFPDMVRHHLQSVKAALQAIPFWVWFLPFLFGGVIILLLQSPLSWITEKPLQEVVAAVVIGNAALLVLLVCYWVRELFALLLAVLVWALFFRELHFTGTSKGLYLTIIVLAWLASSKRDALKCFMSELPVIVLLSGAMWTYLITKLLDRNFFTFLPNYYQWSHNVEETLETFGHLMIMTLVVVTLRIGSLRQRQIEGAASGTKKRVHQSA